MSLPIQPVTSVDLPAVLRLQATCYPPSYQEPLQAFAAKLQASPATCWCVPDERQPGELLGYLFCLPVAGLNWPALHAAPGPMPVAPDALYLHDLAIHPDARGTGLAPALVGQAVAWAQAQGWSALRLMAVQGTASYWDRWGFTPIPETDLRAAGADLSSYGEQACPMQRVLAG